MKLTKEEILIILDAISEKYGSGYSGNSKVATLQATLPIMLKLSTKQNELYED